MREVIEKYVSIWNDQEILELPSLFSHESRYWDATQEGDAMSLLRESITGIHEAFSNVSFEILACVTTGGNHFFLEWQMKGTNTGSFYGASPTGKSIQIKGLDFISFESDKIAEIKSYYDSSQFNQQLGIL